MYYLHIQTTLLPFSSSWVITYSPPKFMCFFLYFLGNPICVIHLGLSSEACSIYQRAHL